ncbi:MAG: hypothetical protein ACRAUN_10010 [Exiguobacterium profundum]|uniref:hypothetical protein n=1 Tax=Exiguobacterium sp. s37 TaxID=2751275 RepID=UPI001BEC69D7|nr:hypothetical protein [Exiguobacterium sp. s37]
MYNCVSCNKQLTEHEIIHTDELGHFGDPIKQYCDSCFIEGAKIGFHKLEIGCCTACQQPLVLQFDKEETASLAREDKTVHYICPQLLEAYQQQNEELIEQLEDVHDQFIFYVIQPDPTLPDFG